MKKSQYIIYDILGLFFVGKRERVGSIAIFSKVNVFGKALEYL